MRTNLLHELGVQAVALARATAVLGDGAPTRSAADLAGLAVDDAERAADALAAAGILAPERPLRFAHPILRAALYSDIAPGARAVAHRRAVRLLMDTGAALAHALAVEPAGDEFVAEALLGAGRGALAIGTPELAAGLLRRALAEPPPPGQRAAARALLGVALGRLGDERAVELLREALAETSLARERSRLTAELADALWIGGDPAAALAVLCGPAGELPAGVAAAEAARTGAASASAVARLARAGVDGATALERCHAVAALIACDELEAARRALAKHAAAATAAGARVELRSIEMLAARAASVAGGVAEHGSPLPGPDPGPAPWAAWLDHPDPVERFGTPAARAAALQASAKSSVGVLRIEQLERAVDTLRDSPRRPALAVALAELGRALRHAGRRAAARSALRESLDLSQRLGLAEAATQAREELRIAGARPRRDLMSGPDSLTAAELRVAEVAARGLSNRDIAASLFLSPKTVEMHLGRVYRKLGIGSRAELPAGLAGVPDRDVRAAA
jgi:DNA-binding CsgD family transcriptional regulator